MKSRSRSAVGLAGETYYASPSPGSEGKRSYYKDRLVQNPLVSAVAAMGTPPGLTFGAYGANATSLRGAGLDFVEEGPAASLAGASAQSTPAGLGLGGMPASGLPLTPRRRLPRGRYAAALLAADKGAGADDPTLQAAAKLWRSKPTDIEYR